MSPPASIEVQLLADTTFGGGDPVDPHVDIEIDHDRWGLPRLGGKALHGLLRDGWLALAPQFADLQSSASRVLGAPGDLADTAILRVGDAVLDETTRGWVEYACSRQEHPLTPTDVLEGLTDVRVRTAREAETGAPARGTLRAVRVALRGLRFEAPLHWQATPSAEDICCLALSALTVRHAGLGRQRGAGRLRCTLDGDWDHTTVLARGAA